MAASSRSKLELPLLAELWVRMHVAFPHRWGAAAGQTPDGVAGRMWADQLGGMTAEQIARGLRVCLDAGDRYPPGPGEFRDFCLGVVPLEDVAVELADGEGAYSPFTRLVGRYLDWARFRESGGRDQDAIARQAWRRARRALHNGEPLPTAPVAAIEKPKAAPPVPADPEKVAAEVEKLRALFGQAAEPLERAEVPPGLSPVEREAYESELAEHYRRVARGGAVSEVQPA